MALLIKDGFFRLMLSFFSSFQVLNIVNHPNFKKAKFDINANKTIKVKIVYL